MSEAAALSVSEPLPVQPLTVKMLPPAVSVRLAIVIPLKVNVAPPVTASDVFARTTLLDTLSARVSDVPLSVPLPVQPVTVNVLPPEPLSVRLAVVIPLRPSDMLSVEDSKLLASVKPALLLAVTVSPLVVLSMSDPPPVQPLTVKVLPPAVSVRLAVVNPLSVRVGSPLTARDVFVNVVFAATVSTRVSPGGPVNVPLPVQPLTVTVLPPELVSVRLAVVIPMRPSVMPSVEVSEVLVKV